MAKKYPPAPCPIRNFQYHEWPQIEETRQQAVFLGHNTNPLFEGKVYLLFRIHGGTHDGELVYMGKNADLKGRTGWGGEFRLGKRRDLFTQLRDLGFPGLKPGKRMNLAPLCNVILDVELGQVEKDVKQRPISKEHRYSVVRRIVSVDAGSLAA